MGRARSQTQMVTAAAHNFNAVLGASRGSVAAQARRDAGELLHLQAVLDSWRQQVMERTGRECPAAHSLIINYCDHASNRPYISEADMIASMMSKAGSIRGGLEVARICYLGDPVSCPGLTAAAVAGLGRYLGEHPQKNLMMLREQAANIIEHGFPADSSPEYFQRLEPLCEGVGAFLAGQSSLLDELFDKAAGVLQSAPTESLTGPLRSWVEAFAHLLAGGARSNREHVLLQKLINFDSTFGGDAARKRALTPIWRQEIRRP